MNDEIRSKRISTFSFISSLFSLLCEAFRCYVEPSVWQSSRYSALPGTAVTKDKAVRGHSMPSPNPLISSNPAFL